MISINRMNSVALIQTLSASHKNLSKAYALLMAHIYASI